MTKFVKDQRVVVDVRDDKKWNKDVLVVLQGKGGAIGVVKGEPFTIEKTQHNKESYAKALKYLVMFDTPTDRTSRGVTHSAFWFDEDEIKEEGA